MPHQDTERDSRFAYNHQALKTALDWLLKGVSLAGARFREDCTWTPRLLVLTALFWVWSDEKILTGRFAAARKIAMRMCPWLAAPAASYQAFTKLLRKWTETLVTAVQTEFRAAMRQRLPKRFWLAGFIPFGVDGSRFSLPRTASHERAFAPAKRRKGKRSKTEKKQARRQVRRKERPTKKEKAARSQLKKAENAQL